MSSAEIEPSGPEKSLSKRTMLAGLITLVFVLVTSPFIARTVILMLRSTIEIPLPTLDDPDAIKPETVADIQLLSHWGNGKFNSIAWSPDGHYFVIGTSLGVNLYDGQTYQLLSYTSLPLRDIELLAFSPDSTLLAVASERNILLMDLANDKILQQWDMDESIADLIYLADGTLVCVVDVRTGGNTRTILKLDNERWKMVKTLDEDFLVDMIFVPEIQSFVVYYKNSVHLVNPLNGKEEALPYHVPYEGDFIFTRNTLITLDGDRNLLSAYSADGLLNGKVLDGAIDSPLASPDGSLLAAIGPNPNNVQGDALTLWKIPELEQIRTIWVPDMSLYVHNHIVFSPSGERLALLVSYSVVKIFPTAENNTSEITINDPFASITDIAFTSQGEIRAVSCSGTAVDILELPSAVSIDEWYFDEPTCGQLLDDGVTLAISEPYEPIHLYRVGEMVSPVIVSGHCCSKFSSTGSVGASSGAIASSGDPVPVTIWQKEFGQTQKWNFFHEGHEAFHIAVSPTGYYVAATSGSNTYLWVHGIKSAQTYPPLISRIAFSPDEKYLASVNGILDLETGHIDAIAIEDDFQNYPYHTRPVFSPDGQILAAEVDGTLRFWNTGSGALLAKLDDPDFTNYELIFSSDGRYLVGLGEGFVNVWGLSTSE
ncbi:MAG: WD40 repeat domain-containing protein [Anaerolineales bacterium]